MYFNFEDNHPDIPTLPRSLTRLEVVLLTIVTYMGIVIAYLLLPELPFMKELEARRLQAIEEQQRQQLELERQRERENARFVFVAPRIDMRAERAPDRAELSDIDRRAATVERAPNPTNPLPFARGNTTERIEASRPVPAQPQPSAPDETPPSASAEALREGMPLPSAPTATEPRAAERAGRGGPSPGVLADAIRNVQKYVEKESFGNLQGGGVPEVAPSIQFDTKGVEFGPWLRRFVAQIRRNWFVPYAAMSMRGHVVVTFFVHKDGRITDLRVAKPSTVDAFTNSAYNAMASSNPTHPLPPEYPDDRAFFTVTFFFNEGQ
jgi:TonB family protein